jgi:ATP-dependent helicase HrpB
VSATVFLPVALDTVRAAFPGECVRATVSEFDARQGRVVKEERVVFRGLVLSRKEETARGGDRRATADIWAEKYAAGELRHPGRDEKVEQFLTRVALARKLYPDMGWPEMNADDWRLVYGEVCAGRNSAKDIERVELLPHLQAYLGRPLADFLDRALPASRRMPSGKSAKFVYHETNPAELSARLGDFVGMTGTMALCEGRLPVVFDILAPNYRTVQKTRDLASFWANAYPTVKKELKRRYPRHPWP